MLKLLADQNLYNLPDILPDQIHLSMYDPNEGLPNLLGFDALFIRSVTKIGKEVIDQFPSSLKFLGTGSSGSDHVDKKYLKERKIHFSDAKGSNANVVAEYVVTSLILLSDLDNRILTSQIGIIGVGAVGTRVNELLNKMGFKTVLYDPPKEELEPNFKSATLNKVLNCEVLTFHTPINTVGKHKTFHWLDESKLEGHTYLAIINAARGGIIDEQAVLKAKINGHIQHLVIDVWENEPDINPVFAKYCDFATPHIAGSSIQSKLNASNMLAEQLCTYFGLELPEKKESQKEEFNTLDRKSSVSDIISQIHPIRRYDTQLRALLPKGDKKYLFSRLRTDFPYRNEYKEIHIPNLKLEQFPILEVLGIQN